MVALPRAAVGQLQGAVIGSLLPSFDHHPQIGPMDTGDRKRFGAGDLCLQFGDRFQQGFLNACQMVAVTVGLARPEEPFQSILLPARDDVNVKMRHALTHAVVDRDECPFSPESLFHRACQQLRVGKQRREEPGWKVSQSANVLFGNEEAMPWKDWAMVEKGQGELVIKHPIGRHLSLNDAAKGAIGGDRIHHGSRQDIPRWPSSGQQCSGLLGQQGIGRTEGTIHFGDAAF